MNASHPKPTRVRAIDLDLVPHPRAREMARRPHGRAVSLTSAKIQLKVAHRGGGVALVETAVLANVERQKYGWTPRSIYVDLLKRCTACLRPFIFYVNEQRFWYETLQFDVDVDCVKCVPCRKRARRAKNALERYASALHSPRLDASAMKTLVDDTLYLAEQGLVTNLARLGAIKNRALRELGAYRGTRRLAQVLAEAREAADMRPGAWRSRHWATLVPESAAH